MPHALIIDDQQDSAEVMADLIAAEGFSVATAGSLAAARRHMALQSPDIVFLDLVLPDGSSTGLIAEIKALPNTRIVLIAPHTSIETSTQALRIGAANYVSKPIDTADFRSVLSSLKRPPNLTADALHLQEMLDKEGHFGLLWGRSHGMLRIHEQILRVAGTSVTVLVTGESGSGKEVVTRMVHKLSHRHAGPFLAVNCGAISPHLIESEMFGHEKGSFTGAERQHQGFFERASGGTLFLDEITEMPLDLQVKLLRVLETGTFMRVGSTQTQEADVRVVAASNKDPLRAVTNGSLREDLLYRLNVFPIHMPPLRERLEDIPLLAQHFLDEIARREGQVKHFSPETLARLTLYHWPGNARELRNIVHRAYVMASDDTIVNDCLPTAAAPMADGSGMPTLSFEIGTPLAEIERMVTLATLEHFGRHKERTAAALGVSLKTLYNRLKEYSSVPTTDIPRDVERSNARTLQ
ncbi:MAG: sigma-54 dependent transcriptional regulator [Pseudomonadota bacterium]